MEQYNHIFIRDMKLPISISKEPYFSYLLNLIDPYYESLTKYEAFKNAIEKNGFEEFTARNKELIQGTIDYLKSKPEYEEFNNLDMSEFDRKVHISKKELYHPDSVNNRFISIDLTKANFQSFRFAVPEIFDGSSSYNDFMMRRGADEYMLLSKQIRQVIFGNLNPQRQQKIQLFIMNNIAALLESHGVDLDTVYSLSSDELVFEAGSHTEDYIKHVMNELPQFDVRVEEFVLERPFKQPFYVKRFIDGTISFKLVPSDSMAEFIKRFEGKAVEEMDLYYYDNSNKRLAKFIEPFIEDKLIENEE